jgi:hypothetical protein
MGSMANALLSESLLGKYRRLRAELRMALQEAALSAPHKTRLVRDLEAVERQLAAAAGETAPFMDTLPWSPSLPPGA